MNRAQKFELTIINIFSCDTRAHLLTFSIGALFRVIILVLFGWQAALESLLAGIAVLQIPLMLNVICHIPRLGYKSYATADDSVNVWWVGILAMGEGWHNNHHAECKRRGKNWYEIVGDRRFLVDDSPDESSSIGKRHPSAERTNIGAESVQSPAAASGTHQLDS